MKVDLDELLVSEVAAHAGALDRETAASVTDTVVSAFGARLDEAHRMLVAEELPPRLAATLRAGAVGRASSIESLVLAPGRPVARARELVASVCRAIAAALSEDALAHLRAALPEHVACLLVAPSAAVRRGPRHSDRHTLAETRPGSGHPISEAAPHRAQASSIAAPNPHGDVKLSSSEGTTQERLHDTLAEATSDRAIARRRT